MRKLATYMAAGKVKQRHLMVFRWQQKMANSIRRGTYLASILTLRPDAHNADATASRAIRFASSIASYGTLPGSRLTWSSFLLSCFLVKAQISGVVTTASIAFLVNYCSRFNSGVIIFNLEFWRENSKKINYYSSSLCSQFFLILKKIFETFWVF